MRLCSPSILIIICFTGLGFYPSRASTVTPNLKPKIVELAQASSPTPVNAAVLSLGSQGTDVEVLQTQLKELGYYNSVVNGKYDESTEIAVSKFQQAKGLIADGITGKTTRDSLQAAIAAKNSVISSPTPDPTPTPKTKPQSTKRSLLWWLLMGLGVLGGLGATLYLVRWFIQFKKFQQSETSDEETLSAKGEDLSTPPLKQLPPAPEEYQNTASETDSKAVIPPPAPLLPLEKTSRLAKLNIVDELIKDLRSSDPTKRSKAIWDLGQQGDSRAIQPLVDLMMGADSQQHGLILAALTEISIRTLKPMNRALAMSMQDESPQVRQNAIRDLTRVYDMMGQMSQILRHAAEDTDPQVQATAQYALNHLNRVRVLPKLEDQPEDSHQEQQP